MGEYAEDRLEWEMGRAGVPGYGRRPRFDQVPRDPTPAMMQDKIWTTKEGEKIRLEDLTPRHRGHIIAMLERACRNRAEVEQLRDSPLMVRLRELELADFNTLPLDADRRPT